MKKAIQWTALIVLNVILLVGLAYLCGESDTATLGEIVIVKLAAIVAIALSATGLCYMERSGNMPRLLNDDEL